MAIATAATRGAFVYVYDEKNRQILTLSAGNKPEDGLTGDTSSTVSVRRGGFIYTTTRRAGRSVRMRHDGDQGGRRGCQSTHPPRRVCETASAALIPTSQGGLSVNPTACLTSSDGWWRHACGSCGREKS
jgi:hypothetical protein